MAEKRKLTDEDNALLAELGIEIEAPKEATRTAKEERIISGFKEIQNFVEQVGRLPAHGEDNDIFERLLAVRLDQIKMQVEIKSLVQNLDYQGLLDAEYKTFTDVPDDIEDEELLKQLGVNLSEEDSITNLKHVKSRAEKKAAEEIANRTYCEDFERFKPLFKSVQNEIDTGYRTIIRFRKDEGFTKTSLKIGQFIILAGQFAYVAEMGDSFKAPNGEDDARLRVIYANGTESNILLRSLIRAMYKDETSRFITDSNDGPLFSGENSDDDYESGTIYVLRSQSEHPFVKENRNIVHKIGVTGGELKKRLANAKNDPTYLLADVEIVATYKLANLNRLKLEKLIQKFFSLANLDIQMNDRFGKPVKSTEWYVVPIFIIDEMVNRIKDGTVSEYFFDPLSVELKKHINL